MSRARRNGANLVAGLLAGLLVSASAHAQCTTPPSTALSLRVTRDWVYAPLACGVGTTLWNGLHLETGDWDEGYGLVEVSDGVFEATCNGNHFLTRLLNGAYIVLDVQGYAVPFGQHRQIPGLVGPLDLWDHGGWWLLASTIEPDEWEPECSLSANASNHSGCCDEFIGLKIPGAYKKTAMYRAAIVIHEPIHEDVGHVDDGSCVNMGSCDLVYGGFNANTFHVNFLYDAAASYVSQTVNTLPVRPVQQTGGQCSFIPRFTPNERAEALNKAEGDLDSRFAQALPPGLVRYPTVADLDTANGQPFDCSGCDTSDWQFDPNVCVQTACNEVLNTDNAGVNVLNSVACSVYDAAVSDPFLTPEEAAVAKQQQFAAQGVCLPPDPADVLAHCAAEKASAAVAQQVDQCGWLDAFYSPELSHLGCVEEFCQEKWNESGGWNVGQDPFLCGSYLCGSGHCDELTDLLTCQEEIVILHADPELYVPSCNIDNCKSWRADCLVDLHKQNPPAWSYGEPLPIQCQGLFNLCEAMQQQAMMVWAEYGPLRVLGPGPGPDPSPELLLRDPLASNPAVDFQRYLAAFRAAADRGASDEELGRMARNFTAAPEMIAALFHAAPGEFVGMFGAAGFEQLLGPRLARTAPIPIDSEQLSPRGLAALAELQRLLDAAPPDQIRGAIGNLEILQP